VHSAVDGKMRVGAVKGEAQPSTFLFSLPQNWKIFPVSLPVWFRYKDFLGFGVLSWYMYKFLLTLNTSYFTYKAQ